MIFNRLPQKWRKLWKFAAANYFLILFIAIVGFVGLVSAYRMFLVKPKYVYAKVKVSQGLWWANTGRAPIWFVNGLKKDMARKSPTTRNPKAKIVSMRYYPYWGSNQYDIYLLLRLRVNGNSVTGYSFNRSGLVVGSPIEFSLPSVEVTGTVLDIYEKQPSRNYVEKTITLVKSNAYPWEYDGITVGDRYFNGEEVVFEVLSKSQADNAFYNTESLSNSISFYPEPRKVVTVKARIKLQENGDQLVYGEEQEIKLGKNMNIGVNKFQFEDFQIAALE